MRRMKLEHLLRPPLFDINLDTTSGELSPAKQAQSVFELARLA